MKKKTEHIKNAKTGKLEGSLSLGGKVAPTAAVKITKASDNNSNQTLLPPGALKPMTASDLDWQQDYEDYLFGIEDMCEAIDKDIEPDTSVKDYFREKAKAISRTEFGKQVLNSDLDFFGKMSGNFTQVPIEIISIILS